MKPVTVEVRMPADWSRARKSAYSKGYLCGFSGGARDNPYDTTRTIANPFTRHLPNYWDEGWVEGNVAAVRLRRKGG